MKKEQKITSNEGKELPSLKDVEGMKTNPFMVKLKGKMYLQPRANTIIAKGQEIVDTTTGEILRDDVLIGRRKVVDKSQFAKIYANEIGSLFELSKPAINVFLYLTKVMDFENKAIFDYIREYKALGYKSHKQCLFALRELISKNIIYPHFISGIWWLNPTIVCKGERFAKYTEYVTKEYVEREARKKKDLQEGMMYEQAVEKRKIMDNSPISYKIDAMERKEREENFMEYSSFRKSKFVYSDIDTPLSDDECLKEFENNI